MKRSRRKLSAVHRELDDELHRLLRIDAENQRKYSKGPGRPAAGALSKRQLHVLTEAIFFAGYRQFEQFLRDMFLLYCLEKSPPSKRKVVSYLNPQSFRHAEMLILSSMRFLKWTNPEELLDRAETYLKDGYPVKEAITPRMETLKDLNRIRNHIAHRSPQSLSAYLKVLRKHYGVTPLKAPNPGEFLLETDKADPSRYKLLVYLDFIRDTAKALV